jgi:mRNA-degrading endonuclease RelE of RelBE toxin-antitoxin system
MRELNFNTVVELPTFISKVDTVLLKSERDELIDYLAKNPGSGDEIPRTGGIRKLRWAGKGKGKRGGARVIYYFYNDSAPIFLLSVYGKNEQENLKPEQEKKLTKLAALLKEECKKRSK